MGWAAAGAAAVGAIGTIGGTIMSARAAQDQGIPNTEAAVPEDLDV